MKTVGIILIILQCMALFGSFASGDNIFQFGSVREIGNFIGYFSFAIVGVILLVIGNRKEKQKEEQDTAND